jgi:hypothetical protein
LLAIAGLDPAIHPIDLTGILIDARVKPAHDDLNQWIAAAKPVDRSGRAPQASS